jgi:flagellar biosynthesis protein FlhG
LAPKYKTGALIFMIGQAVRVAQLINNRTQNNYVYSNTFKIAITSGKGGTGKSFIALNLGFCLASLNKKILLVDLDFNFPCINIMVNQALHRNLSEVFNYEGFLSEIIFEYNSNLHFVFNDGNKIDPQSINSNSLQNLFNQLSSINKTYDYIIFDTSSGIGQLNKYILEYSDMNLIISNPEPTSVMDAYSILKVTKVEDIKIISKVIFNKCSSKEEGKNAFENLKKALEHFLKINPELGAILLSDSDAAESIRSQEILYEKKPGSLLGQHFLRIADNLIKVHHLANNNQPN